MWIDSWASLVGALLISQTPHWHFEEVAVASGVDVAHGYQAPSFEDELFFSGGAALGDIDLDGWLDLYLITGDVRRNLLLRNTGGQFVDISDESGIDLDAALTGASFADMNGDGLPDLITGTAIPGQVRLFRNEGNNTFSDVSAATTFPPQFYVTSSTSFGDYDRDGDLDLFLAQWNLGNAHLLWRNEGNFSFQSVSFDAFGATAHMSLRSTFTPNFTDINNDGWLDLLVASDFGRSQVLINDHDGTFTRTTTPVISDEHGMGAAVGDYDNDGDLDWFVTSIHYDGPLNPGTGITGNRMYQNQGDGTFVDVTDTAGVRAGHWGWGACFADFDNDGFLDIFHVNGWRKTGEVDFGGTPARLFINQADGSFLEQSEQRGIDDHSEGRGVVCFDYDRDGDIDVLTANSGGPFRLYRNELQGGRYLNVQLKGSGSNRYGVGAKVRVQAAGHSMLREIRNGSNYLSSNPLEAHFGLADADRVTAVEVTWPDGKISRLHQLGVNQSVAVSDQLITRATFE